MPDPLEVPGVTWTPRESNRYWSSVTSSADGTKLVATVSSTVNSTGGAIYTSVNSGVTWTPRESGKKWFSVASSSDGTKLVAAGQNGVYTSTDSGATWTPRGLARLHCSVASSSDGTKLVAAASYSSSQPESGKIYLSTDSGHTWTAHGPRGSWSFVASSSNGTKLIAGTEDTYFGDETSVTRGQIYRSTDSGDTWILNSPGLVRYWLSGASSSDGTKIVAVANYSPTGDGGTPMQACVFSNTNDD